MAIPSKYQKPSLRRKKLIIRPKFKSVQTEVSPEKQFQLDCEQLSNRIDALRTRSTPGSDRMPECDQRTLFSVASTVSYLPKHLRANRASLEELNTILAKQMVRVEELEQKYPAISNKSDQSLTNG